MTQQLQILSRVIAIFFVEPQYAGYLDTNHPENIEETLKNAADNRDIRLIVVTDAEWYIGDWRLGC